MPKAKKKSVTARSAPVERPVTRASSQGENQQVEEVAGPSIGALAIVILTGIDHIMNKALIAALKEGDVVKTRSILEDEEIDIIQEEVEDTNGKTMLHIASEEGHIELVKYIIDVTDKCIKQSGKDGNRPQDESQSRLRNLAQYLDVNESDNNGFTPLYLASKFGHLDVVECLVRHGADLNKATSDGDTPLCISSTNSYLDVVECLVSSGAEVNKSAEYGWTPLHVASQNNHINIVKYLIAEGANIDAEDDKGRSSIYLASKNGHLDIVECLVNAGADVNKSDKDGWTPLHVASQNNHIDIVKYLNAEGANQWKNGGRGFTLISGFYKRSS
nr:ankyrin-1-like [Lytechinus pictus]